LLEPWEGLKLEALELEALKPMKTSLKLKTKPQEDDDEERIASGVVGDAERWRTPIEKLLVKLTFKKGLPRTEGKARESPKGR